MENEELEDQTDENTEHGNSDDEPEPKLSSDEKKKSTKWRCPECKQTTTFFVAMSVPPTCSNPNVHPNKTYKMEPV